MNQEVIDMSATIQVKVDLQAKELATRLFNKMGLDHDAAIDMFYRQVIAKGELPFERELSNAEKLQKLVNDGIASGKIKATFHEANEKGELIIDKEKHPEMWDWAVNG